MTRLSIEEMAGQRLMLGFDGQTLNTQLKHLIRDYKAGGYYSVQTQY